MTTKALNSLKQLSAVLALLLTLVTTGRAAVLLTNSRVLNLSSFNNSAGVTSNGFQTTNSGSTIKSPFLATNQSEMVYQSGPSTISNVSIGTQPLTTGIVYSTVVHGQAIGTNSTYNAYLYQILFPYYHDEDFGYFDTGMSQFLFFGPNEVPGAFGFGGAGPAIRDLGNPPPGPGVNAQKPTGYFELSNNGLVLDVVGPSTTETLFGNSLQVFETPGMYAPMQKVDITLNLAPITPNIITGNGAPTQVVSGIFGFIAPASIPYDLGPVQFKGANGETYTALAYMPNPEPGSIAIWSSLGVLGLVFGGRVRRKQWTTTACATT